MTAEMAEPLARLLAAAARHRPRGAIVHRAARSGPVLRAVRPGVQALTLEELLAGLP